MTPNITIIDTKSANLVSVKNAFEYIGFNVAISKDADIISNSSHLVLPGVGSFDACIKAIDEANLRQCIKGLAVNEKKPIMGICVGMQAMFEGSKEGSASGLGLLQGQCVSLKPNINQMHKVPHNGFADVHFSKDSKLNNGLRDVEAFYFNHSYGILNIDEPAEIDWVEHTQDIVASFQWKNIFGIQFHPEKSQRTGLKILYNFIHETRRTS